MFGNCIHAYNRWQHEIYENYCKKCVFVNTPMSKEPCKGCKAWQKTRG
nr:MAG: hypothetical protein [Lokiarchaeota virus Ratatoskr Meg22_1012]